MEERFITEENAKIRIYGEKISKDLNVFYNPIMKLNRDISLLIIKTYFNKKIRFCDPMSATGIREIRFLKSIPEQFETLTLGDISETAIKDLKDNFKLNKISLKNCKILNDNAINTINSEYFDFIEIDPFGSPLPFLDIACQKIKHNGILSVTATDTAALCGTYPKTSLRKYGIKTEMMHWYEEFGLRNLIAYCIFLGAKYEKNLIPQVSYSDEHYYKIFFKVEESRTKALNSIKSLRYISWDKKTQDIKTSEFEKENYLGKTYIGNLNDKEFLKNIKSNLKIISDNRKASLLLNKLEKEMDTLGHYNPHKLEKEFKINSNITFAFIEEKLKEKGFEVSRPHNNRLGIKTNAKGEDLIKIMEEKIKN